MRSGPDDNVDFNAQYVLDLIWLLKRSPKNFWAGKGVVLPDKEKEEAAGIISLKSILQHYEEKYKDFYHNEAALLEFFNTCRNGVGGEMIKLDKKNPNACELYKALIDYDKGKIKALNETRLKVLEFDICLPRLMDAGKKANIAKHEKDFQKICQERSDRPYLLLLQDYLFNVNTSKDNKNGNIASTYGTLKKYAQLLLVREDAMFLKAFPTPAALALCVRSDMYCPVMHDKKAWVSYLNTIGEREEFANHFYQDIDTISSAIMNRAFSKHFNAIFKDVKDVEVFLKELEFTKYAAFKDGPKFDMFKEMIIKAALREAIEKNPEFLNKIIAENNDTIERLCDQIKGLEIVIIRSKDFAARCHAMFDSVSEAVKRVKNLETQGAGFDEIKKILVDAMVNNPKFIESLSTCDQDTKKYLYNNLPGLEAAVKKKTFENGVLGLLFVRKHGDLKGINKDIIKKIAGHAADVMGANPEEDNSKKLKK